MDECGAWDVRSWWRVDERIEFGTGGVLDVCLCFGVGGEWVGGLDQGLEG